MQCNKCGSTFLDSENFCTSCGTVIKETRKMGAGFLRRTVAFIIDFLIARYLAQKVMATVLFISAKTIVDFNRELSDLAVSLSIISATLIYILYFTVLFGKGRTVGMFIMRLRVQGTDGTYPIGYKKGLIRTLGMFVSSFVFLLGFFWIIIDRDKQGWHDKIADTYVVIRKTVLR